MWKTTKQVALNSTLKNGGKSAIWDVTITKKGQKLMGGRRGFFTIRKIQKSLKVCNTFFLRILEPCTMVCLKYVSFSADISHPCLNEYLMVQSRKSILFVQHPYPRLNRTKRNLLCLLNISGIFEILNKGPSICVFDGRSCNKKYSA